MNVKIYNKEISNFAMTNRQVVIHIFQSLRQILAFVGLAMISFKKIYKCIIGDQISKTRNYKRLK